MVGREIEPEKMVIAAPKNELKARAETTTVYRFLIDMASRLVSAGFAISLSNIAGQLVSRRRRVVSR